jgi:peptide/nickel transport system substrate-binding protein
MFGWTRIATLVAVAAAVTIATGVAGATSKPGSVSATGSRLASAGKVGSAAARRAAVLKTANLRTRAGAKRYLRALGLNPHHVVIQRGIRNYAGASCPGAGWSCTSTAHPVVQIAAVDGKNTFHCATARCAVIQVAATGTKPNPNFASCIRTTGLTQSCSITQLCPTNQSCSATNKAIVVETANKMSGLTQTASYTATITQGSTSGSNTACAYQTISIDGSTVAKRGTQVNVALEAHQSISITQDATTGANTAENAVQNPTTGTWDCDSSPLTQRQTMNSSAMGLASITQNENATDGGPNVDLDIEQNQGSGYGTASGPTSATFTQTNTLNALALTPVGPVTQTQSSLSGGLQARVNQYSSTQSTATANQAETQCERTQTSGPLPAYCTPDSPSLVPSTNPSPLLSPMPTEVQHGPLRKGPCCSTQAGSTNETFTINQSSTQNNDAGQSQNQTNDVQADCSTGGTCTVTQDTSVNGSTTHNVVQGTSVNASIVCSGGTCTPSTGGTAVVDTPFSFDFVDPALANAFGSWQIEYATCLKLVDYPDAPAQAGSQLQPDGAQSIDISADGLTYTFTLRPGYVFSPPSNAPVTADAFKRALERVLDPAQNSPGRPLLHDIVSIVSDGDRVLQIQLAHPDGSFLARLALPFSCAVPPDTPVDPNGLGPLPSAGPYYVTSYTPGSQLVLTRNPNYPGPRPASLDQIVLRFDVDPATALAQVEAGTADYATTLPPDAYAQVAQDFPSQLFVNPLPSIRALALNTSRPLFSSVAARQAVNLAINRTALLAAHGGGAFAGSPNEQYLPPTVPGFRDEDIYPLTGPSATDLARANALVDQAGIRGQTAVLYVGGSQADLAVASLLADELAQIGINVDVHSFANVVTRIGTLGEPFDIADTGWIDDYLDPANTLNVFFDGTTIRPTGNFDWSYFNDPSYNAQLEAASLLTGPARYTTYGNLDVDLVRNAAPLAAYGTINQRDFFSARMGCQTYVPQFGIDLASLCVKR